MEIWEVAVLGGLGMLVLLFAGGMAGNSKQRKQHETELADQINAANNNLAAARASDRGWDLALLEAAARSAFTAGRPGETIQRMNLVQVVDRPGTDEDRALMRVTYFTGEQEIELQRTGDSWHAA
jgi:hypothetical protein